MNTACEHLAIVGPYGVCTHSLQRRQQPGMADREVTDAICAGCTIRTMPSDGPQRVWTIEEIEEQRQRHPVVSRGLGDTVANVLRPVARVLHLENCGGCGKRQGDLNKLVPYNGDR